MLGVVIGASGGIGRGRRGRDRLSASRGVVGALPRSVKSLTAKGGRDLKGFQIWGVLVLETRPEAVRPGLLLAFASTKKGRGWTPLRLQYSSMRPAGIVITIRSTRSCIRVS